MKAVATSAKGVKFAGGWDQMRPDSPWDVPDVTRFTVGRTRLNQTHRGTYQTFPVRLTVINISGTRPSTRCTWWELRMNRSGIHMFSVCSLKRRSLVLSLLFVPSNIFARRGSDHAKRIYALVSNVWNTKEWQSFISKDSRDGTTYNIPKEFSAVCYTFIAHMVRIINILYSPRLGLQGVQTPMEN